MKHYTRVSQSRLSAKNTAKRASNGVIVDYDNRYNMIKKAVLLIQSNN